MNIINKLRTNTKNYRINLVTYFIRAGWRLMVRTVDMFVGKSELTHFQNGITFDNYSSSTWVPP